MLYYVGIGMLYYVGRESACAWNTVKILRLENLVDQWSPVWLVTLQLPPLTCWSLWYYPCLFQHFGSILSMRVVASEVFCFVVEQYRTVREIWSTLSPYKVRIPPEEVPKYQSWTGSVFPIITWLLFFRMDTISNKW